MEQKKCIVKVNASFAVGRELFAFIKKYAQHSNDTFAFWDEFAFTTTAIPESDALLIFNQPSEQLHINCDPGKVIAFMMEPGIRRMHPWMFERLSQYARVFSPLANASNVTASHGYLGWYFKHDWNFLRGLPVPAKSKMVSCIASGLTQLRGHRLRTLFINSLRKQVPQIDYYGNGTRYLPNKLDGLLPYRYSIAIENTSAPDYFTEKINDCFLSYTVPLYYGCTNIGKYFPERSFINLDITRPELAARQIEELMQNNDWDKRIDALQEARQLVLNKYQPLAGAANILRQIQTTNSRQGIVLRPIQKTIPGKIISLFKELTVTQPRKYR